MRVSLVIRAAFWLWLFAAMAVGHFHLLQRLTPPAGPIIIVVLTAGLVLLHRRVSSFHDWVERLDLRTLVLLHVTRLIGFYFLMLYRQGQLPYAFAVPGGIGDIAVAIGALAVIVYPLSEAGRRRAISIWNVVGLIDILLVVFTAARIGASGSRELAALTYLPLSLLPTFLVPLIIACHLAIFARVSTQDS
jgi:hypothetical protein